MKLSLRNQLSLWVGFTILVIVFVMTFTTQRVIVWNLERSIDENLQKHAYMVASIISSDITTDEGSYYRVINDLANQELSFVPSLLRVISPKGEPIIEFGKLNNSLVQQLNAQLSSPDVKNGSYRTILLDGAEPMRAYSILVFHPQTHQALAFVQILESLTQVQSAEQELWRSSIIIGLFGSIVAIIIGQILVFRGFRRLREIMQAIDNVDYKHLRTTVQEKGQPVELEQLTKSLSAMWLRLDMAVGEQRKATGSMSHDLRTPLTTLQGQIEVLLLQPSLNPETRDSLNRMLKEIQRLIRLVKNLLLNAQLESSPNIIMEEINFREILDEVISDMWILANELKFNVLAPNDVFVWGNSDLLKQMLINIVDNAIKFTPRGGQIDFNLAAEDGWAVLKITDSGYGIPSEQLLHVTEAFYNVGASRKSAGEGSRLGLSIVKRGIELHNGEMDIQSSPGVGTSVTIRLPRAQLRGDRSP